MALRINFMQAFTPSHTPRSHLVFLLYKLRVTKEDYKSLMKSNVFIPGVY